MSKNEVLNDPFMGQPYETCPEHSYSVIFPIKSDYVMRIEKGAY